MSRTCAPQAHSSLRPLCLERLFRFFSTSGKTYSISIQIWGKMRPAGYSDVAGHASLSGSACSAGGSAFRGRGARLPYPRPFRARCGGSDASSGLGEATLRAPFQGAFGRLARGSGAFRSGVHFHSLRGRRRRYQRIKYGSPCARYRHRCDADYGPHREPRVCAPARGGIAVAHSNEVWGVYRRLWLGQRRRRSKGT